MANATVFSGRQRELLVAVLNRVIPGEINLPGAGDLGVASAIERNVLDSPRLRRIFAEGLAAIDLAAWQSNDRDFVDLESEQQDTVLKVVERDRPEFFDVLITHTYRAYYVNPRILLALGIEARPPQPNGYHLPAFDETLLDNVRRRGRLFRQTDPRPT